MSKRVFSLLLNLIFCCCNCPVHAYPEIAGHCTSGGNLYVKSRFGHGEGGGDNIEKIGYEIIVESRDSSDPLITLDPSGKNTLRKDNSYTVTLKTKTNKDTGFKGFLFRLKGENGEDASQALSIMPAMGDESQELDFCGEDASGISHRERSIKTSIPISLYFKNSANLLLEVTVVQENSYPNPMDDWGYSAYKLVMASGRPNNPTPSPTIKASETNIPSNYPTVLYLPSDSPAPTPNLSISILPGAFMYIWMITASFYLLI